MLRLAGSADFGFVAGVAGAGVDGVTGAGAGGMTLGAGVVTFANVTGGGGGVTR